MNSFRKITVSLLVAGLGISSASLAYAQSASFPERAVTIVVPFAAGGVADGVPRIVGQSLSKKWGVPVIVENKPGASGNIGMAQVARSAPDGYTYALAPTGNLTSNPLLYSNLPFNTAEDFVPVALLATSPNVLVVNESVPVNTLAELIDYAKAKPGTLNYASPGAGSGAHLASEQLNQEAGIDLTHIPYSGMSQAVNDVLGGNVEVMFAGISTVDQHIKAGKLKGLAIASLERSPHLPTIPTADESGLPGFDVTSWYALVAPKGVDAAILDKVNADIVEAMHDAELQQRLYGQGVYPSYMNREEFAQYVQSEAEKWGGIIKKTNIQPLN